MEKVLYWKIQVANQSPSLEPNSKEMEIYKSHYLKDFQTREKMTDTEAVEHYNKNAWKNPLFSRLHSLTLAFVENDVIRVNHFTGSEKDLLIQFINTAKSPYFNDFKMACFDAEYLLPYLGIRIDKNDLKEVLPNDLLYRGLKPWGLTGICIRNYYQGAGAYKPTLKELAYIYNLEENIDSRYEENDLALSGDDITLTNNSIEEIKLLINAHRKMNYRAEITELKVSVADVKDVVLEEPKTLLHELYETKCFDTNYQNRLAKHLKAKKLLKRDIPLVKDYVLAVYLEKIEVTAMNKKELEGINAERRAEVEEFFKDLK